MARDGEHKECPIIPDQLLTANIRLPNGEQETIQVAKGVDVIYMFPDSRLNYLQYVDNERNMIDRRFLGHLVLATLHDYGIPVAFREDVNESEVEAHKNHCFEVAEYEVPEIYNAWVEAGTPPPVPRELMPGDPIDAQVQSAMQNFDAEAQWFPQEWAEGRDGTS